MSRKLNFLGGRGWASGFKKKKSLVCYVFLLFIPLCSVCTTCSTSLGEMVVLLKKFWRFLCGKTEKFTNFWHEKNAIFMHENSIFTYLYLQGMFKSDHNGTAYMENLQFFGCYSNKSCFSPFIWRTELHFYGVGVKTAGHDEWNM